MMRLRELAHSRTGDKGNLITVSVIAYHQGNFDLLVRAVTVDRAAAVFRDQIVGVPQRYLVPNLWALNFVLHRPMHESVTRSLALDAHGKSLGSLLLDMELDPDKLDSIQKRFLPLR